MRLKLLIPLLAGAVALTTVCVQASAAPPTSTTPNTPAIRAKKAQAAHVLSEIAAIDERLNATSEQYDGARLRLTALRKNLRIERAALTTARTRYAAAQKRAAKLLVWLYTSSHSDSLDIILGAHSLTELLRLSDAENAISKQATVVTNQAQQAKQDYEQRVHTLNVDRKAAQATVNELASRRAEILRGLAERRQLLKSVQTEVNRLEAAERARQARLAAEAAARLKAELAARAKAEAEAAAKAKAVAEAAAAAKARAALAAQKAAAAHVAASQTTTTTTTATTTPEPPVTATTATTTTVQPPSPFSAATPPTPLTGPLPGGHPEAAQLALAYLGVPYVWGGSSPIGFDCSGLVTYVYAQLGVSLPHFAAAQWDYGVAVSIPQLQPGDLVFFDALDHVGIYLGNNQFIDAPHTGALVRIDTLGDGWYAKHYVGARRI
ncbi:MAG TPA: NlpC/P60 family protein [Gaiellaceae bacterium]